MAPWFSDVDPPAQQRTHFPASISVASRLALPPNSMQIMEHQKPSTALFDVFLRLRPGQADRERFLDVEDNSQAAPTHITIKPPASDKRKRAVERFAFTRVFEENAGQRDIFETSGAVRLLEGVLGAPGREGSDGTLATLGVTGSGKVQR